VDLEGQQVSGVRVQVDIDLCQGHLRCTLLAPEVFGVDDMGFAVVLVDGLTTELATAARRAQANCPEAAIVVR
jgi:ferredoxin